MLLLRLPSCGCRAEARRSLVLLFAPTFLASESAFSAGKFTEIGGCQVRGRSEASPFYRGKPWKSVSVTCQAKPGGSPAVPARPRANSTGLRGPWCAYDLAYSSVIAGLKRACLKCVDTFTVHGMAFLSRAGARRPLDDGCTTDFTDFRRSKNLEPSIFRKRSARSDGRSTVRSSMFQVLKRRELPRRDHASGAYAFVTCYSPTALLSKNGGWKKFSRRIKC